MFEYLYVCVSVSFGFDWKYHILLISGQCFVTWYWWISQLLDIWAVWICLQKVHDMAENITLWFYCYISWYCLQIQTVLYLMDCLEYEYIELSQNSLNLKTISWYVAINHSVIFSAISCTFWRQIHTTQMSSNCDIHQYHVTKHWPEINSIWYFQSKPNETDTHTYKYSNIR